MKQNKFVAADRAFSLLSSGLSQETDKSAAMAYFRGLYATTEAVREDYIFFLLCPWAAHTYTHSFFLCRLASPPSNS